MYKGTKSQRGFSNLSAQVTQGQIMLIWNFLCRKRFEYLTAGYTTKSAAFCSWVNPIACYNASLFCFSDCFLSWSHSLTFLRSFGNSVSIALMISNLSLSKSDIYGPRELSLLARCHSMRILALIFLIDPIIFVILFFVHFFCLVQSVSLLFPPRSLVSSLNKL